LWPDSTEFIKTFRAPTPLLVYQLGVIPGAFITGILLAPLLVLSRSIAQKPVRRLRFPHQKEAQRRLLALGFYVGVVLVAFLLIGTWTRWCLGGRDPWLWVLFWLLEGQTKWSRIALLAYWTALVLAVVISWQAQFTIYGQLRLPSSSSTVSTLQPSASGPLSLAGGGNAAAEKRSEPHRAENPSANARHGYGRFGLNGRRKSFHALAVLMFAPGIIADVSFFSTFTAQAY
jgi:dolichol kinase